MEFKKENVYYALNATDELVGAKGYFADDIHDIICCCDNNLLNSYGEVVKVGKYSLKGKQEDDTSVKWNRDFNFFYLIEESPKKYVVVSESLGQLKGDYDIVEYKHLCTPKPVGMIMFPEDKKPTTKEDCKSWIEHQSEHKCRPFKDCDELIEAYEKKTNIKFNHNLGLPIIWVKKKSGTDMGSTVTDYDNINGTFINDRWYSLDELFEYYTFLDKSVCGVEE